MINKMVNSKFWDILLFVILISTFVGFIDLAARPIHGSVAARVMIDGTSYRLGQINITSGSVTVANSTTVIPAARYNAYLENGTILSPLGTGNFTGSCQAADPCTVNFDYYSNSYLYNSRDRNIAMLLYLGIFVTALLMLFGMIKKGD